MDFSASTTRITASLVCNMYPAKMQERKFPLEDVSVIKAINKRESTLAKWKRRHELLRCAQRLQIFGDGNEIKLGLFVLCWTSLPRIEFFLPDGNLKSFHYHRLESRGDVENLLTFHVFLASPLWCILHCLYLLLLSINKLVAMLCGVVMLSFPHMQCTCVCVCVCVCICNAAKWTYLSRPWFRRLAYIPSFKLRMTVCIYGGS